ncbi:hypothetical protein GMOD_00004539 [Pyrenophora seminiperda CCB06]|uniref:Uncharacterized protein n=1 Tax=Pyrenophora seminiperda CCB06 TaxID=1302712 RepID=A0A3M7MGV2_9PLEO|nr:hypothetical protein GMOD_00004539 [Pyrenophora seminiperda CCB06]
MGRFYNPFQSHRLVQTPTDNPTPTVSGLPTPPASAQSSDSDLPDGPDEIRCYVRKVELQVQWLQERLAKQVASNVGSVNEAKRALKSMHRGLEKVHVERCPGQGDELEAAVGYAVRRTWRAYISAVKLEEKMKRGLNMIDEAQKHYLEGDPGGKLFLMSGALPIGDGATLTTQKQRAERADPLDTVTIPSCIVSSKLSTETSVVNPSSVKTNPEQIPQPRQEVKRRVLDEEANPSLELLDPDRARRGSCNGFMVTHMTVKGLQDERFVLPYLHYMKLHELQCLKQWLTNTGNVAQSGPVSRTEKVLLCMLVLQSGCRYESLAVIHSRSPRQIKEACNEVMQGLLRCTH